MARKKDRVAVSNSKKNIGNGPNFRAGDSEINFDTAFDDLIDPDSALFLDEALDPFPRSDHGYLSDINVDINRESEAENENLFLYISKEELVSSTGIANNLNIENSVIRTISINSVENNYLATYLHPDEYYFTVFLDADNNSFPSPGDFSSVSTSKTVNAETIENVEVTLSLTVQ